jgi:hypothetical protein
MPTFFRRLADRIEGKATVPANQYEGFDAAGRIILRDRRGTRKDKLSSKTRSRKPSATTRCRTRGMHLAASETPLLNVTKSLKDWAECVKTTWTQLLDVFGKC